MANSLRSQSGYERPGNDVAPWRHANFWYLLLYFIGFGLFLIGMPKYLDDYGFTRLLKSWMDLQGDSVTNDGGNILKTGIPFRELFEANVRHTLESNARIGNNLLLYFLLFPKWVGSSVALLAWVLTVPGGFRLVGINWRTSALVPVCLLMFWYAMPWSNHMGSLCFQFNYVLGLGAGVGLLYMLRFKKEGKREGILFFIVGLICGMWLEAISVPICGALSVMALAYRRMRNKRTVAAIIGLASGIALLFLSPGIRERFTTYDNSSALALSLFKNSWNVLILGWFAAYQILLLINLACRRLRYADGRLILFIETVSICSLLLFFKFNVAPRILWIGNYFLVMGIALQLRAFAHGRTAGHKKLTAAINLVMMCFLFTAQAYVGVYALRMRASLRETCEAINRDPFAPHFGKSFEPYEMPLICWDMPEQSFNYLAARSYMAFATDLDIYTTTDSISYVPEILRDMTSTAGTPLKGVEGARLVNGHIVVPADNYEGTPKDVVYVDFGKGYVDCAAKENPFISEADGRKYIFIDLQATIYIKRFKTPQAIAPKSPARK